MMSHNHSACPCPSKKTSGLSSIFKKGAACAGPGLGGFAMGHAGCFISAGLSLGTSAAAATTGGMSVLTLAFSAAATAVGLLVWRRVRGQQAGKWERRLVIAGALTGLAVPVVQQTGLLADKSAPAAACH